MKLIFGEWRNHYFGYRTFVPNLYIDNLSFAERLGVKQLKIFSIANKDAELPSVSNFALPDFSGVTNKNVYTAPEEISIKNLQTGVEFSLDSSGFFSDVRFENEK